jgi:hypothetical protein
VSETDLADAPISEQRERAQQVNTESDDKLATWDPMKDAFESPVFNSYEKKTVLDMSQDPRTLEWVKRDKNLAAESQHSQQLSSQSVDVFKSTHESYILFVRNIPLGMTQEGLRKLFSKSGSPASVKLLSSKPSASSRSAFVKFISAREADTAIRDFDGFQIRRGLSLKVSLSRDCLKVLSRDSPKFGQLGQIPMQPERQMNGSASTFITPSGQVVMASSEKTKHRQSKAGGQQSKAGSQQSNAGGQQSKEGGQANAKPSGTARSVEKENEASNKTKKLVVESFPSPDGEWSMSVKSLDRGIRPGDCGELIVTSVLDSCTMKGSLVTEGVRGSEELFRLDGLSASQTDGLSMSKQAQHAVMLLERLTIGKILTAMVIGQATDRAFLVRVEDKQSQKNINDIVGGSRFVCKHETSTKEQLMPVLLPNPDGRLSQTTFVTQPWKPKVKFISHIKLPEGCLFSAVISEIVNPTFYIQVAEGDNGRLLRELSHQITHHCTVVARPTNRLLSKNELVSACYPVDGCWYRARVLQMLGDEAVEVAFVDYGNRATVQLLDIQDIPHKFLQLPAQAVQCLLMDFKGTLSDSKFDDNALEFLKSVRNLKCEYVPGSSKPSIQFVKLFDASNEQNPVSVGDKMVEIGLALRVHRQQSVVSHSRPPVVIQRVGFGRGFMSYNGGTLKPGRHQPLRSRPPLSHAKIQRIYFPTTLGSKFDIVVTHIASPTLFWAQLADQKAIKSLRELMMKMTADCNAASQTAASFQPEIGAVCCAKYRLDNNWYRATVNAVNMTTINVKFIDFGNDEILARNELQQIKEEYLWLPVQAVKFALFGGSSLQLRGMTERFSELCLKKKLKATVREQLKTYLLVDLTDLSVTPPVSIISELQKGEQSERVLTLPFKNATQSGQWTPSPSPSPDTPSGGTLSPGPPNPEATLCNPVTQCLKADTIPFVALPHTPTFDIVVTNFESPSCFYGQLTDAQAMKKFSVFSDNLNKYYAQQPASPYRPSMGEVCCAFCRKNQSFYRAETVSVLSHDEIGIRYIDYGNTDRLRVSDIHRLDAQFMSLPKQAICFKLAGLTTPTGQWKQEAVKLCQDQKITCRLHYSKFGKAEVELIDSSECDTVSVNQQLVNQRLTLQSKAKKGPQAYQPVSLKKHPVSSQALLFHLDGFAKSSIPSSAQFVGLVTVVDSPESFFIQIVDLVISSELADLTESMTDYYTGIAKRPFVPVTGTVCAGRFSEDGKWYRAHLMQVDLEKRTALVCYPDFGNKETIPLSSLAVLVDVFRELPLQAIHCCLSGVESLDVTEAMELMKVKVMNKQVIVRHDPLCTDEDPHPVDIIDPESGALLSSVLVEQGVAELVGALDTEQLITKVEHYYLTEVAQVIVPADGFFTLMVVAVDNPACFWGQVVSSDTVEWLAELSAKLTEHCDSEREDSSFHPEKGELCCAKFLEDDLWYRAAVEKVEVGGTITVRFVDFGNAENVTAREVKPIPRSFLSLPLVAVQCQLSGIKPKMSVVWPPDATNGFKLLVEGRKLVAKLINMYNGLYSVELYDTSTEVDVVINKELVDAGLADPLTS